MELADKIGIKTNMVLTCEIYTKNLSPLEFRRESIGVHSVEKILFYIVLPANDLEEIKPAITTGKEGYKIAAVPEEPIFGGRSLGIGWLDQYVGKLKFYETNLCDFSLVLDSDSCLMKDFFVDDFMFDAEKPYMACHEGKAGRLLNIRFGKIS
jgi:hypothetical protein